MYYPLFQGLGTGEFTALKLARPRDPPIFRIRPRKPLNRTTDGSYFRVFVASSQRICGFEARFIHSPIFVYKPHRFPYPGKNRVLLVGVSIISGYLLSSRHRPLAFFIASHNPQEISNLLVAGTTFALSSATQRQWQQQTPNYKKSCWNTGLQRIKGPACRPAIKLYTNGDNE